MSRPILYRHVGCPYCERVVRVLGAYDVDYRSRFVTPTHSERDHVKRISGGRSVPLWVDDERGITMAESGNIVDYVRVTYGDQTPDVDGDALFVDLPAADHVSPGDRAPEFSLPLVNRDYWEDVSLQTRVGDEPTLLVFFPMDGTGGASYTWIEIRERGWDPDRVVGVSVSTPYGHRDFIHRHDLQYDLYSDPGNVAAERFGVVHDHGGMAVESARPAAFLIDPDMTVAEAYVASRWPADVPYDEIEGWL